MQPVPDGREGVQSSSFDKTLLRTVSWGTAAALALGAAVFTAQTHTGTQQIQLAFAGTVLPQPVVADVLPTRQSRLCRRNWKG